MDKKWIAALAFIGLSSAVGQQPAAAPTNKSAKPVGISGTRPATLHPSGPAPQPLMQSQHKQVLLKNEQELKLTKNQAEHGSLKSEAAAQHQSSQAQAKMLSAQRESALVKSQVAMKDAKAGTEAKTLNRTLTRTATK